MEIINPRDISKRKLRKCPCISKSQHPTSPPASWCFSQAIWLIDWLSSHLLHSPCGWHFGGENGSIQVLLMMNFWRGHRVGKMNCVGGWITVVWDRPSRHFWEESKEGMSFASLSLNCSSGMLFSSNWWTSHHLHSHGWHLAGEDGWSINWWWTCSAEDTELEMNHHVDDWVMLV